jgi:hypothetical protein
MLFSDWQMQQKHETLKWYYGTTGHSVLEEETINFTKFYVKSAETKLTLQSNKPQKLYFVHRA